MMCDCFHPADVGGLSSYYFPIRSGYDVVEILGMGMEWNGMECEAQNVFESVSSLFHAITRVPKEIPAFARRWSFEDINEKSKDL